MGAFFWTNHDFEGRKRRSQNLISDSTEIPIVFQRRMSTTTKVTFEEFLQLPNEPGQRYELDRGELIREPAPTFRHNMIRDRIAVVLREFVIANRLGTVTIENDFRLDAAVVRNQM